MEATASAAGTVCGGTAGKDREQMTKFKSMTAFVAAGALAGAALVGIPTLAAADRPAEETQSERGAGSGEKDMQEMGAAMSDPQFQEQMKSAMSAMMSDEEMREQMSAMMSKAMGNMDDQMGGGDMGGSGMGGMGGMGSSGADSHHSQDDPTP